MKKKIIIILGEPNSISSEIFLKSLKYINKTKLKFIIIGNYILLKKQAKYLDLKININFHLTDINNLNDRKFNFINIEHNQLKPFDLRSIKSDIFIKKSFETALTLIKKKLANGIINLPINKSKFTKNKYKGITEYIADKTSNKNKENMLLYNENFSVLPLTTHIPLKNVHKEISFKKIEKACKNIYYFYSKILKKKKIKIGILGLNPHNGENGYIGTEEKKIITPSIKKLKKKYLIIGPLSPDTSFLQRNKFKIDVLIGHYHDQVLTAFKNQFDLNAINITIGLPFIRISPDHGIGTDIIGRGIANPKSFKNAIKFFSKYNV
ncbi:PdxA family dehydrogenase [Candidatus Fonsibacter ubiquis]|uniref:PdxA family dehydrogenase n=1 Tax=Candidatus Fonsibacter ubiquis TaxID=1925548 RepID=UPI000C06F7D9|nr:4-hydroxythreonine-4-phosphate dehydrogenase PdxA [Candidatus Fonsibacter ubiquis]